MLCKGENVPSVLPFPRKSHDRELHQPDAPTMRMSTAGRSALVGRVGAGTPVRKVVQAFCHFCPLWGRGRGLTLRSLCQQGTLGTPKPPQAPWLCSWSSGAALCLDPRYPEVLTPAVLFALSSMASECSPFRGFIFLFSKFIFVTVLCIGYCRVLKSNDVSQEAPGWEREASGALLSGHG